jgi:hypothetical protein
VFPCELSWAKLDSGDHQKHLGLRFQAPPLFSPLCFIIPWIMNGHSFKLRTGEMMEELVDFGAALAAVKSGSKISREGWNGKGM